MKKFLSALTFCFCLFSTLAQAENIKDSKMKIKLTFDNKEVIVKMADNSATRQLIQMLPATFKFTDFAGQEKITDFPKPVSLTDAPRGMIAEKGKMFIYAPWGNLGFFYKDHGHSIDKSLIELGEIESGLEHLSSQKGGFTAEMSVINGEK